MAKSKGDSPNFDELMPLGDDLASADDGALADGIGAEPVADEGAGDSSPPVEKEPEPTNAKPIDDIEEEEEEPSKLPLFLEVIGLIVVPLVLLAMAGQDLGVAKLNYLSIWTSLYLIGLGLIAYALWKARQTSTLYTVFLGCVLAGMLTGVYCLWMELAVNYKFDINAQEAKRKVGMLLPTDQLRPAPFSLPGDSLGQAFVV